MKVEACGLNPVDSKAPFWKSTAPDMDASWVTGLDVSGTIVAIGEDVTAVAIGDRIICHGNMFRPHGGFAAYTIRDSQTALPHPNLDSVTAA